MHGLNPSYGLEEGETLALGEHRSIAMMLFQLVGWVERIRSPELDPAQVETKPVEDMRWVSQGLNPSYATDVTTQENAPLHRDTR